VRADWQQQAIKAKPRLLLQGQRLSKQTSAATRRLASPTILNPEATKVLNLSSPATGSNAPPELFHWRR
jgi:hypothetical protein